MVKIHKRKKRSRLRGEKTCGWGARKKHRGKGSRGGVGMAGTGKRAGQKLTLIKKYMPGYFGKKGFKSIKQQKRKKLNVLNVGELEQIDKLLEKGIAKKSGEEIVLKKYKILGGGELTKKLFIRASAFSSEAIKKIEKVGGKATTDRKEEKFEEKEI